MDSKKNSGNFNSGHSNSRDSNSGSYNSGDSNSRDSNSGSYNSGDSNSGDSNSGSYNSGHSNSGDSNSGSYNSGDSNSGSYNSGDYNSGVCNSGHYNSGHYNSGGCNSGNWNSGNRNSGNWNSGSWNYGFFNTDNPTVRCFNKETGIKREDFKFPNMDGFQLTEYKDGKLVTYEYKEAWKNFWNKLDNNRKLEFTNLPNFDSKIFEKITGIKTKKTYNKETLLTTINIINNLESNIKEQKKQVADLKNELNKKHYKEIKMELL